MSRRALSARELEVLVLIAAGLSAKAVAELLGIARGTVEKHCKHIYEKLGARNRTEAAMMYLKGQVKNDK